jgi:hypothetical protein
MMAAIYEFVKFMSNIFILAGISCFFNNLYSIGFLMFASFLIVKLIDSDWAFEKFKFRNHNAVVIFTTFALIILNMTCVYQSMKDSAIFVRATEAQQNSYLNYENSLFAALKQCSDAHNRLLGRTVSEAEGKQANLECASTINLIDKIQIPDNKVPSAVLEPMTNLKDDFKYIALNLSHFNYSDSQKNSNVNELLKTNLSDSFNLIEKLRAMLSLYDPIEDNKKNAVKIQ